MAIIQNTEELGTTPLRQDALAILEAGLDAIRTERVIQSLVSIDGEELRVGSERFTFSQIRKLFVVAIGKCALDAAEALENILGERIAGGVALDIEKGNLSRMESLQGSHPLPSRDSMYGAERILELLRDVSEHDVVIFIISGGGSSLFCLPLDPDCKNAITATRMLMERGATIGEINIVRRHTSRVKGGQLAVYARPARAVSLIFSDVPGDDVTTIASGPTVLDPTSVEDAREVLARYGVAEDVLRLEETPKDPALFNHITNILALTNQTALDAMGSVAEMRGYEKTVHTSHVEGDIRVVAQMMLKEGMKPKSCHLWGGETTVVVKNPDGKGGRNQELVLSILPAIPEDTVIVAAASDGWDNSDVAGALGDSIVFENSRTRGMKASDFLEANNSYLFFEKTGGHIRTGRTGSNVSDLYFTLHT